MRSNNWMLNYGNCRRSTANKYELVKVCVGLLHVQ